MNKKIISPCISICRTDPVTGFCYGCARTIEEKKQWKDENISDDWKEENLKIIITRMQGWQLETFKESIACLKIRGMMVSFGNASGPLDPVNVPKDIQPKGLYLTRPSIGQYFTNRKELQAGADAVFEKVKFGKIKIKISKEYSLIDAKKAHEDLEARKLTGPAILIP